MASPAPSPLDAELLALLEDAFRRHAAGEETLDTAALKRALGLRSDYLARRVLAQFDRDGDGTVDKREFLDGVRALVLGSDREKLAFAFRLWDHDGDGRLDREELHRMVALSLAESDVEERPTQPAAQLVAALLSAADTDADGRLSLEELERVVRRHPELLARMTRSEAIWIAPNEELLLLLDRRAGRVVTEDVTATSNRRAQLVALALWALANVAVFAWSLTYGRASETSDGAMQLGRAVGACIDLDAGFVLLPVMRRLLSWIRPTWFGRVVPVDDAISFHQIVGHTLFALALTHSAALVLAYGAGHASQGPLHVLATGRGLTGGLLLGVFAVMWIFSQAFVRRSKRFEVFYFTHLLYVVWLALIVAHGPRILVFSGVAMIIFVVEQLLRLRRRRPAVDVVRADPLRSGVTRIEIARPPGFTFGAGDYVFLRIPAVARHEWHPFTISSAPEVENLVFHVRSLGNWTAALRRRVEEDRGAPLVAYVDGPYGSPSARIFASRFVVLIGAGIGVTPFASVLESAVLRPSDLEKVHFFWLNRDQYSFEWFRGLLSRLEAQDARGLLDIHLCMTGARSGVTAFGLELARAVMHDAGRSDMITGLRTKTHVGHPDWEAMLGAIAKRHAPAKVDVFFCGPHALAAKLAPLCRRLGMTFREEQF